MERLCPATGEVCAFARALEVAEASTPMSNSGRRGMDFVIRGALEMRAAGNCEGVIGEDSSHQRCGSSELASMESLVNSQADFIGLGRSFVAENFSFTRR